MIQNWLLVFQTLKCCAVHFCGGPDGSARFCDPMCPMHSVRMTQLFGWETDDHARSVAHL